MATVKIIPIRKSNNNTDPISKVAEMGIAIPDKGDMDIPMMNKEAMQHPAVIFEANRIACPNGEFVEDPTIYNKFVQINAMTLNNVADTMHEGACPAFAANTISACTSTMANICVDSFVNSLYSHYLSFNESLANLVRSSFGCFIEENEEDVTGSAFPYVPSVIHNASYFKNTEYMVAAINNFVKLSIEERNRIIDTGAFIDFCISYVNNIGACIYSATMEDLSGIIFRHKFKGTSYDDFIMKVNGLFSLMMGNMSYEISAFNYNMQRNHTLMFSGQEIDKLICPDCDTKPGGNNYPVNTHKKIRF